MRRFVLTGAPGAGKTVLLQALADRGRAVVAEAATDVIAELHAQGEDRPWTRSDFVDRIVDVQRQRQMEPPEPGAAVQIFDRSPLCTLALAKHLGRAVTPLLATEVARVVAERVYQPTVFVVEPLGFIEPTVARRISYDEALAFHTVHQEVYRSYGYDLVDVPAASVAERAELVQSVIDGIRGHRRS